MRSKVKLLSALVVLLAASTAPLMPAHVQARAQPDEEAEDLDAEHLPDGRTVLADPAVQRRIAYLSPAFRSLASPQLRTFGSQAAFDAYLEQVDEAGSSSAALQRPRPVTMFAQTTPPANGLPCPTWPDCPPASDASDQAVIVTGATASNPTITNNQVRGVDEGDIVKQIGDWLVVLQDGRLFSVNTAAPLALADRQNVYTDPDAGTWYDEMLVDGDHILVTAYNYRQSATELSIFKLDTTTGQISPRGTFLITSDDYYDWDNYATRIVDGKLIVYTPYNTEAFQSGHGGPTIRRWLSPSERAQASLAQRDRLEAEDRLAEDEGGRPILDAHRIYRPVFPTATVTIHTISICPLAPVRRGDDLSCRTTGFAGPEAAEMLVTPESVFLVVSEEPDRYGRVDCRSDERPLREEVPPAAVYRVPLSGRAPPDVIGINGLPHNQFGMEVRNGRFYMLARWTSAVCSRAGPGNLSRSDSQVALFSVPLNQFSDRWAPVRSRFIAAVPDTGAYRTRVRFSGEWLIYTANPALYGTASTGAALPQHASVLAALPLRNPASARPVVITHQTSRLEPVGDGILVTGRRFWGDEVLHLSWIRLGSNAVLSARLTVEGRVETEGRSHAFNSSPQADGSTLMGLPTALTRNSDGAVTPWWSRSSDISYFALTPDGRLEQRGEVTQQQGDANPNYGCEVSCIDWYGNARPIFTNGRIFALMGTQLVEAQLMDGQMGVIQRVDLTQPVDGRPVEMPLRDN